MNEKIPILLLDEHELFRESLSRLLHAEPDIRIAGSCGSLADALAVLNRESVDMILFDYDLGEDQGLTVLQRVANGGTRCPVLILAGEISSAGAFRLLRHGFAGIFLKARPPAQLLDAIRKVVTGELWVDPSLLQSMLVKPSTPPVPEPMLPRPTPRELDVLRALLDGLNNKEIAARLGIRETAVKWALQQLFRKTGAHTRSQLIRLALELREWISQDSGVD